MKGLIYKMSVKCKCFSFVTRSSRNITSVYASFLIVCFFISSKMIPLTIAAVFFAAGATAVRRELPEFIRVCRKNHPEMKACLHESIENLKPYLAKGIPEIGIPPLEPLYLEELTTVQGKGITISAKDIRSYGASNFDMYNVTVDQETLTVHADIAHPHLYIEGTYHVDGKVLLLPLTGSGPIRANLTGCWGHMKLKGVLKRDEDGDDYLYCTDLDLTTTIGKGKVHLGNLFGGDPTLGEVVNKAINSNFDVFVKEIGPVVEKALAEALRGIANNVAKSYTYNQLFPDS